ncbi:hypothetical protein LTR37_003468 [Vermiconidia calcicola]|uniref:Uncharacterized protein n=1 Tax=Vermiconidia calcicola TaxID=1690605 RepID=A0ACC3NPX3_9PEZI|nr:hypothetical protein LTR37_003468 [Vermiconidia calcicola]
MPGGSTIVDVTYDDPRTGQRVRERRIQEIPDEEVDYVRQRERDMVLARRPDNEPLEAFFRRDYYYHETDRSRARTGFADAHDGAPRRARSDRGAAPRRRSPSSSSASSSESSANDRRRHRRGHRRARSERAVDADDDGGYAWYSEKPRRDCNFFEKNFDSSYDGIFAAAAGAAIGAMTARRFAYKHGDAKDKQRWKALGGAAAGATAFNLAENRYRVFTEEKEVRRKEERAAAAS